MQAMMYPFGIHWPCLTFSSVNVPLILNARMLNCEASATPVYVFSVVSKDFIFTVLTGRGG